MEENAVEKKPRKKRSDAGKKREEKVLRGPLLNRERQKPPGRFANEDSDMKGTRKTVNIDLGIGFHRDYEQVREMRLQAELTQAEAAKVVHVSTRTWQKWEGATRRMHPAMVELFEIKTASRRAEVRARKGN